MDNEFLILLQAGLDEAASKGLINDDIKNKLQGKINQLQLTAVIDDDSISAIKGQLEKILNHSITISNINIDTGQAAKNAQQAGQNIGNALNQGISSNIKNIKENITSTVKEIHSLDANDIIKKLNLNRASVGNEVISQVRLLVSEINNLGREAAKTNSDSAWEQLIGKCSKLGNILDTFGKTRSFPGMDDIKRFADYFNGKIIDVGYKNSGLSGTDFTTSQLNRDLKDLSVKFVAAKQGAIELDTIWEEMCNTTGRMDLLNITNTQDQIQTVINELLKAQSIIYGEKGLIAHPNAHGDVSKYLQEVEQARNTVSNLQNEKSALMQKESQEATTAANTIVQNEERKQQAYQETVKLHSKLASFNEQYKETGIATINENGVIDMKKSLEEVRNIYSDFGKVTIKNEMSDLAKGTEQFRVSIESSNGELKRTESFLMKLSEDGKSFVFADDMIRSSENVVRHLNEQQDATDKVILEEEKLANRMGDVREKSEQIRKAEEQRQLLAQSNAINKTLEQEYNQRQKIAAQMNAKANKIQLSIETGGYESKVETLIARTKQWTDSEGQARINTNALSNALTQLTQASEAYANNKSEATQKRLIESSKQLDTEYQKITNAVRKMNAEMAKDSAISSLHNQVNDFMSKNGKAVKYSGEFMRIFNETAQGAKLTREEIVKLNQEFNTAIVQARNAGKLGKTFFQTLREGMRSFSYWTSSTFLVMKAIQEVRKSVTSVKELDTALVDLKKTTTMTAEELEEFYYASNDVAKQMGVSTEEIISQAAAWSRLGFSSNEAATKMAQLSSKFASISPGMSTDEAQEGLVSIIKAWGLDVDEVEREVMDNINTLGKFIAQTYSNVWDCIYAI